MLPDYRYLTIFSDWDGNMGRSETSQKKAKAAM